MILLQTIQNGGVETLPFLFIFPTELFRFQLEFFQQQQKEASLMPCRADNNHQSRIFIYF